jgi:carbon monoxide dehydrogenase subunit G
MAFEIVKKFVVKAEPQAVWQFLIDPERVASCLPGAAITGKLDDKTWTGTMSVKVGPVSSSYKGKIVFERLDEASMTADLAAIGQDVKGRGGADMKMKSVVRKTDAGETEVTASSQVNITGILAQMGRGMIQDVSDQMFQMFSQRMRAQLEGAPSGGTPQSGGGAGPSGGATPSGTGSGSGGAALSSGGSAGIPPPRVSGAPPLADAATTAALAAHTASASPSSLTGGSEMPVVPPTTTAASVRASPAPVLAPKPDVLDVGAIGTRAAVNAASRAVRNPSVWIAVAALAGAVYFFLR